MEESKTSEEASAEAVHRAKSAAQAIEVARQAQLAEVIDKTAQTTKDVLLSGLREIFGEGDNEDPTHMTVIYSKIPLLCKRVDAIDKNIQTMTNNAMWTRRIFVFVAPFAIALFAWSILWEVNTSNQVSAVAATLETLKK